MAAGQEAPIGFVGLGTMGEPIAELLTRGPLFNPLMQVQLPKLIGRDFAVQASVANVLAVANTVIDDAREANISLPPKTVARDLYDAAVDAGGADQDATFLLRVFEQRSRR